MWWLNSPYSCYLGRHQLIVDCICVTMAKTYFFVLFYIYKWLCVCSSSLVLSEPSHHGCKTKIPRASSKELRSPFPNFYETELCCTYLIQIWIPYKWESFRTFLNPRRNPDFISLVRKLLISGWPEFHTRF